MKLEVGMYVRTKNRGIAKFRGWNAYDENKVAIHTHNEGDVEITPVIDKSTIIKASDNIIDLIEEGDYVNGFRVDEIGEYHSIKTDKIETYAKVNCSKLLNCLYEEDIETIVTKEQFESMSYKVGE